MTQERSRQIVLASRPQGAPKPDNFRLEEVSIPAPEAGELVLRVRYLSLDPLHAWADG